MIINPKPEKMVKLSNVEVPCEEQEIWTPKERSTRKFRCSARCYSTGSQCKNKSKHRILGAFLVMEVVSCCRLCNIHSDIARGRLQTLYFKVGQSSFLFGLQDTLPRYFDLVDEKGRKLTKVEYGAYGKQIIQNIKKHSHAKRVLQRN